MTNLKTSPTFQLSRYVSILVTIGALVVGTALSRHFFSVANFSNILQYAAEAGLISIGMTLVILTGGGGIDLSVGSVMGIGCITGAMMVSHGSPVWLATAVPILFGAAVGLTNGLLVALLRLEPFIATLVTMTIGRSIVYFMSNGAPIIRHIVDPYKMIAQGKLAGVVPYPIIYLIVAYVCGYVLLNKMVFGRHVYAVGGSEETAKLFGIRTGSLKIAVYTLSGALAGFAGVITSARLGIGDPNAGLGYEMTAITMVVVGGTMMTGGRGSIVGTFLGVLMLSVLANVLQLKNVSPYFQPVIQGAIIIAVSFLFAREKAKGSTKVGLEESRLSYKNVHLPAPEAIRGHPRYMSKPEIDAKAAEGEKAGIYGKGGPIRLAFSQCIMNHPVRFNMVNTVKSECKKYSNVEVVVAEGNGVYNTEIANIESLIQQRPDVMIVSSLSGTAVYPAYEKINQAGIPLVINNSGVPDDRAARLKYTSFISPDDWYNGLILAQYLVEQLGGKGKIIIIDGVLESSNRQERLGGFMEIIKKYPEIEIVGQQSGDWIRQSAREAAENLLEVNAEIDGIYAMNDDMAMGVLDVLRAMGREGEIKCMVSVDGQEDLLHEMKKGCAAKATVYWESRMKDTVNVALAVAEGAVVDPHILLVKSLITRENVNQWIEEVYSGRDHVEQLAALIT